MAALSTPTRLIASACVAAALAAPATALAGGAPAPAQPAPAPAQPAPAAPPANSLSIAAQLDASATVDSKKAAKTARKSSKKAKKLVARSAKRLKKAYAITINATASADSSASAANFAQ
ncbi:MAG: hypothetical protein QOJ12_1986, partial [Thermoleophilales bacterium]|nr:hypothetical protein [Thermoleophilales bacterium]